MSPDAPGSSKESTQKGIYNTLQKMLMNAAGWAGQGEAASLATQLSAGRIIGRHGTLAGVGDGGGAGSANMRYGGQSAVRAGGGQGPGAGGLGRSPGVSGPTTKNYPPGLADAIKTSAKDLGINAEDLATMISFETGGTFDPNKKGPTTKWGQHKGLIQWGEPQRRKYGITDDMTPGEQMKKVTQYLRDHGVKPGMSGANVYAAINAGDARKTGASDAHAGGTWGTVMDKWQHQMGPHRVKARNLLSTATGDMGSGQEGGEAGGAEAKSNAPNAGASAQRDALVRPGRQSRAQPLEVPVRYVYQGMQDANRRGRAQARWEFNREVADIRRNSYSDVGVAAILLALLPPHILGALPWLTGVA